MAVIRLLLSVLLMMMIVIVVISGKAMGGIGCLNLPYLPPGPP